MRMYQFHQHGRQRGCRAALNVEWQELGRYIIVSIYRFTNGTGVKTNERIIGMGHEFITPLRKQRFRTGTRAWLKSFTELWADTIERGAP